MLYEHHKWRPVETKLAIYMPPVSIRCAHTTLVNPGRSPNGLSFSTVMAIVPLYHCTTERQSNVIGFCVNDLTSSSGIFGSESLICQKFKKTISHTKLFIYNYFSKWSCSQKSQMTLLTVAGKTGCFIDFSRSQENFSVILEISNILVLHCRWLGL